MVESLGTCVRRPLTASMVWGKEWHRSRQASSFTVSLDQSLVLVHLLFCIVILGLCQLIWKSKSFECLGWKSVLDFPRRFFFSLWSLLFFFLLERRACYLTLLIVSWGLGGTRSYPSSNRKFSVATTSFLENNFGLAKSSSESSCIPFAQLLLIIIYIATVQLAKQGN